MKLFYTIIFCLIASVAMGANLFTEDVEDWSSQQNPNFAYSEENFGNCGSSGRSSTYAHGGTYSMAGCAGGSGSGTYLKGAVASQSASTWVWLTVWAYFT